MAGRVYLAIGGTCGYGYKVYQTYQSNPQKNFIIPFSLCKGVVGIPEGVFWAAVIPCIIFISIVDEINSHFTNKE